MTGGTETWEEGIDPAAWTERQIKETILKQLTPVPGAGLSADGWSEFTDLGLS